MYGPSDKEWAQMFATFIAFIIVVSIAGWEFVKWLMF